MTLKDKITALCKERKISVRELERRSGLKERTIQHWNQSKPSGEKLKAVANVLGVSVDELTSVYNGVGWQRINDPVAIDWNKLGGDPLDDLEPISDIIDDLLEATELQLELVRKVLQLSDDKVSAILALAKSFSMN